VRSGSVARLQSGVVERGPDQRVTRRSGRCEERLWCAEPGLGKLLAKPRSYGKVISMSSHSKFLKQLQRYTAEAAITPAAVRNRGACGVARAARAYLASSDLKRLQKIPAEDYPNWLDKETDRLKLALPPGARHWGTARKVLNIFLRTATYTSPLAAYFGLEKFLPTLEVPLDSSEYRKARPRCVAYREGNWI
jgi:hypothetical protein